MVAGSEQLQDTVVVGVTGHRSLVDEDELLVGVDLPLPLSLYLKDFSPASRKTFLELLSKASSEFVLPATASRDEAYEATGLYVVEHCDTLIAIWDGRPARGRGGTASIVTRARQRSLPMAWIRARNQAPGAPPTPAAGGHEPTVKFERFPDLLLPEVQ